MDMSDVTATTTGSTSMRVSMAPREEIALVMENPVEKWKDLPACYRVDKECILHVLKHAPQLPSKSDFERQFPQSLRFDPDVVIAFCRRPDFAELYHERHLFVPDVLTNNKSVMLEYVAKIRRQLQECSEELTDDRDIVMAAVSLDGLELQYASQRLRQDEQILTLACSKDGRAFDFCPPGETREKLLNDRDFMMTVLKNNGGTLFKYLPNHLANHDRELLLTAICNGLNIRNVPTSHAAQQLKHQQMLLQDSQFLIEAIHNKAAVYLQLANAIQQRECIARAAITSLDTNHSIQQKALLHAPRLAQVPDVALRIVQVADLDTMKQFLLEQQPQFLDHKQIMLQALQRNSNMFTHCSATLKQDVDIVMAGIDEDSAATILRGLPSAWIIQYPQVPTQVVKVAQLRTLNYIRTLIPPELWPNHRDLQMAWIKRRQRVLEPFAHVLRNDREMALAVAQFAAFDFYKVGESLRGDFEFMKLAVAKDGRVWPYAVGTLSRNMELAVRAVANQPHALTAYTSPIFRNNSNAQDQNKITYEQVQHHVDSVLHLRRVFCHEFLRGIVQHKNKTNDNSTCYLKMLDQGQETGQAFKSLIAQFLGIPTGDLLKMYRDCERHLRDQSRASLEIIQRNDLLQQQGDPDALNHLVRIDRLQRRQFIQNRREIMMRLERQQQRQNPNDNNPEPQLLGGNIHDNELLLRDDFLDEDEDDVDDWLELVPMMDDPEEQELFLQMHPVQNRALNNLLDGLPLLNAPPLHARGIEQEHPHRDGWGARRQLMRAGDMGRRALRERMLARRRIIDHPGRQDINVGAPPIPGERRPWAVVNELEQEFRDGEGGEAGGHVNGHQHLRPPRRPRVMMDDDADDWINDILEQAEQDEFNPPIIL